MKPRRFHGFGKQVNYNLLIDFSTNLNPLGPPKELTELVSECLKSRVWTRYPDPNYVELSESIASFYKLDPECVVPCSGASEAINLAITSARPDALVVVAPSYGDYELLCDALGVKLRYVLMNEIGSSFRLDIELLTNHIREGRKSAVIIINPNNPTGAYLSPKDIISIATEFRNKLFIVDEAYMELSGVDSLINYDLPENVVIIRTFTKTFAAPGLRLGFTYSSSKLLTRTIDSLRPTWNIDSVSTYVYTKLLSDYADQVRRYIGESIRYVREWRNYLVGLLESLGIKVFESVANFILVKHAGVDTRILRDVLAKKYGVAIRSAHTFPGLSEEYSRFSVRHPRYCDVLVRALEEVLKGS